MILLSLPARCAVDLALWDWRGQSIGQLVWRLLGFDGNHGVATSSADGLSHDRELLVAVAKAIDARQERIGEAIELQLDANGGWTPEQVRLMLQDLETCHVVLLEQPLAPDPDLQKNRQGFADLHSHCGPLL